MYFRHECKRLHKYYAMTDKVFIGGIPNTRHSRPSAVRSAAVPYRVGPPHGRQRAAPGGGGAGRAGPGGGGEGGRRRWWWAGPYRAGWRRRCASPGHRGRDWSCGEPARGCDAWPRVASPIICRSALAIEAHRGVASLANTARYGQAMRLVLRSDGCAQPPTSDPCRDTSRRVRSARRALRRRRGRRRPAPDRCRASRGARCRTQSRRAVSTHRPSRPPARETVSPGGGFPGLHLIPFLNHPCTLPASLAVHSCCLRFAFACTNDLEMESRRLHAPASHGPVLDPAEQDAFDDQPDQDDAKKAREHRPDVELVLAFVDEPTQSARA